MTGSLVKKLSYKVCFCPTQEGSCVEAGWLACWGCGHTLLSTSSHLVYTNTSELGESECRSNFCPYKAAED